MSSQTRQGRAYGADEAEALVRTALTELMADGTPFRALSVERLAGAMGMARSTFYLLWEDKPAMLHALSASTLKRLYAAQRSWLAKGAEVTREDVVAGMRELVAAHTQDAAVLRAVAEASAYDPALREAYLDGIQDYARALERFVRAGRKAGRLRDVDPAATGQTLAWMTERTVSQATPDASPRRRRAIADALADVVWATLVGP